MTDEPKSSSPITFADIQAMMDKIEHAPSPPPFQYVVHPHEKAWIDNPVGQPPTWLSVMVAAETGAIKAGHPQFDALMDILRRI